ncbi:MAG: MFS transporter [Oscillospiraceae bacterium]|nr:MFS transporter [Oscillospiraceae bacterium]
MEPTKPKQGLWTRDFTIITLGSVVSMIGNALSGFALSIMVLDYTGSTFLYSLFIVCYQLPMLVCPILAGPYLDRMSRKKVIYRLDFLSAGIYFGLFLLLRGGWFSYPLLLGCCLLVGAINSVYAVAYESFYPNLITEGNYSRAYSISSMLWPLAAMSTPLAALVYEQVGSAPLFAFNALCFLIAACFERTIRYQETHMDKAPPADGMGAVKRFGRDLKEGLDYIRGERGLLVITLYFMVSGISGNGGNSLHLPFFRSNAALFLAWPVAAVTLYTIVSNFAVAGRFLGGLIHYKVKFPTEKKFTIAIVVYLVVDVLEGTVLYMPIPAMAAAFFFYGLLGMTSYNIRIASTQSYIPDTKRARFNGTFQMLTSLGGVTGTLLAGSLAEIMPERRVCLLLSGMTFFAVWLFMFRGRKAVAAIYNREV